MKSIFFICLFVFSLVGSTATGAAFAPPTYDVSKTAQPINIDGKLDDPQWANARAVELVLNKDGSASPAKTSAKLLYDDKFLYVSFQCADTNIYATMKNRDEHLYEEEVVEVFLQPDPVQGNYVELEVNPLDAMLDIYLVGVRKALHFESWNSEKLKWAVQVNGTVDGKPGDVGWTVELAVPFEDLITAAHTPPHVGDKWRINLYRVEQKPSYALIAWSPTLKDDFHMPPKFGTLVFGR